MNNRTARPRDQALTNASTITALATGYDPEWAGSLNPEIRRHAIRCAKPAATATSIIGSQTARLCDWDAALRHLDDGETAAARAAGPSTAAERLQQAANLAQAAKSATEQIIKMLEQQPAKG